MAKILSLPLATRVEVIDSTGRAFTRRYDIAGAAIHIQDDERTIKVVVAEPQGEEASTQKPPFTMFRDAVNGTLNSAHEFLGEPATVGAAVDAVIDRVRGSFAGGSTDSGASSDIPTREDLGKLIDDAISKGRELLDNPEFGGTVADILIDDLRNFLRDRKA